MKQKKPQSGAPPSQYQPSETEKAVLQRVLRRMASKPAPRMKVTGPGILPKVVVDHPDERVGTALLMDAIGTEDPDFLRGLLNQLFNLSLQGGLISGEDLNFMLSVIKSIQPRDPTEAMVAAQMAVAYRATMMYARHLLNVDTTQRENAARAFCKFARVYTTQMDALRRHRSGGERKVTVQHVSVQEGGQAIVGNVTHSPRETAPKKLNPRRRPPPQQRLLRCRSMKKVKRARRPRRSAGRQDEKRYPTEQPPNAIEPALRRRDALGQALHLAGGE